MKKMTKKEQIANEVRKTVHAGRPVILESVDFNNPDRPLTCLEVDFPILPVNQVAAIEGNAGKPIYQMSKWWARRRSSVFRSLLLAAGTKAPEDTSEAASLIWDNYYSNHQGNDRFRNLKVADIFMGGGTTLVEGSRLGMQMTGVDLNPVAWLVVKNEMAQVDPEEAQRLLHRIEADVKPQIMPFYACDCPCGHKGTWTRLSDKEVMPEGFDPLSIPAKERSDYDYQGPEIIYVFWAKHGPCQVTGCGHRTPVMSSPLVSVKSVTVKVWKNTCPHCRNAYDIEDREARMAPGSSFVVAEDELPYSTLDQHNNVRCPFCRKEERFPSVIAKKSKSKKVPLTLLMHPDWLKGAGSSDQDGNPLGGTMTDSPEDTERWNDIRASTCRFVEVRGKLPDEVTCPDTNVTFNTGKDGGTIPKRSHYSCGACGTVQDVLKTVKETKKTAPYAAYAIQGYCPECAKQGKAYGGRFFAPVSNSETLNRANQEWQDRCETDLADYWPRSELPYGFMTHKLNGGIPNHGFTHWWKMFNSRQLLVQTQLLQAIIKSGGEDFSWDVREFVLGAFQQYLRNQNMFCFWNNQRDTPEPMMSNANFHPKSTVVENCVFAHLGRGNWRGSTGCLSDTLAWKEDPWDSVSNARLSEMNIDLAPLLTGKSEKAYPNDKVLECLDVTQGSATELPEELRASYDLVITDPPFGGLLHYSELSDFFYVWLRLALKDKYPEIYSGEYTPKTLEVVANRARQPEDPDGYYQRLLTAAWAEAHRILKPSGLLAFTFHHSEDAPWVQVLESIFDAGFYLEATYPIRSDETKGQGEFGSRKVEYDIIHVCRKRTFEPTPVSWAKMRREVIKDVRQLEEILVAHSNDGLPEADQQVIRRGKALEYFSKHYGKVYVDEGKPISVLEALAGINQLLDEEVGGTKEPPPVKAEPFTRQFLRLFEEKDQIPRNEMQNYLRGTGIAPSEFVSRGWCEERQKVFHVTPLLEIAQTWKGKKRATFTNDYEQAAFMVGSCVDGSGINPRETLNNDRFKPHPALSDLIEWHGSRSKVQEVRNAAQRAKVLYGDWRRQHAEAAQQLDLFFTDDAED